MNSFLSTRAKQIEPSATLAVSARAQALKNEGLDVISLGVGEPEFDTPEFIKRAAIQAIEEGVTKYTAVDGIPALKKAISHKLTRDNHLDYAPEHIIVTSGAKQAIYNLALATLNPGNEVIIPAPYWVSYPPIAKMAEAHPVVIAADITQRFKITPQQLLTAITPQTRWLIINSPNNPSGMGYTASELKALGEILLEHPKILIVSDDIYEYITWSKEGFVSILNVCPELRSRTIVINGVSKAYAMTGWRIGYAAAPVEIMQAMKKIQSQSTTCANSIAQVAAAAALNADPAEFQFMAQAYKKRHDKVHAALNAINGIRCAPADGTFYLFPEVSELLQRLDLTTDIDLATFILEKANVATVPGTAFGSPGHIRFSCAISENLLDKAIERMQQILK